jgi:hypothetical protein
MSQAQEFPSSRFRPCKTGSIEKTKLKPTKLSHQESVSFKKIKQLTIKQL